MDKAKQGMAQRTKMIVMTGIMAALIAVCSWIYVPLTVPFTLQTFAVFFALVFLGGKYGTLSIVVYILIGVIGLPVFSGFKGGYGVIIGPTGGYIVGFVFSGLIFILFTHLFGEKRVVKIAAMVVGLIVCYVIGTLWFMYVYAGTENAKGFGAVLSICVIPFIIPDIVKLVAAYILAGAVKKGVR